MYERDISPRMTILVSWMGLGRAVLITWLGLSAVIGAVCLTLSRIKEGYSIQGNAITINRQGKISQGSIVATMLEILCIV